MATREGQVLRQRWIGALAFVGACALSLSAARVARADTPAPSPPRRADRRYAATLTLDVLDLGVVVAPFFHLDSELRLASRFSLRIGVGYGGRPRDVPRGAPSPWTTGGDAVLEPRWYLLGHFDEGVHLGWLTTFARVLEGPASGGLNPPPGLATGPTIGLKTTSLPLIHVDVDVGPLVALDRASAAAGASRFSFYASFGIGRSF